MSKDLVLVVGFENICRLCLRSTDAMSDIFPSSRKTSLQQQIFYITGLVTKKGDGLPSKICHRCRHIVEQASELRDVVEKSQKILEQTVLNPSHSDANDVKEAEPEPFDNETFLQSLTDSTESIAKEKSLELQYSEPNSPEQQYSELNSPEQQYSEPNSPEPQYSESNSPEKKISVSNSPEEKYTEPNSPQEPINVFNTVFSSDNVDLTTEETAEEEELSRNKKRRIPRACRLCNKQFACLEELRPHVLQHYAGSKHLQIYLDFKCPPYFCTACDEVQVNMQRLIKHHRDHLSINPYRCHVPGCQYVGTNPCNLRRHRSVHDLRWRQCDLCHKLFHYRKMLLQHIARAHPSEVKPKAPDSDKQLVTEIEPYRFGSRWFTREEGHFYVICRQSKVTKYLRCHREGCPARFNILKDQPGPVTEEHNHPPAPWIPSRNSMFQALKRRAVDENIAFSTIYKEEALRYPAAVPHLKFAAVTPSMNKWRRAARLEEGPWPGPLYVPEPGEVPAENPRGRLDIEELGVRPKENPWGRDKIEEIS